MQVKSLKIKSVKPKTTPTKIKSVTNVVKVTNFVKTVKVVNTATSVSVASIVNIVKKEKVINLAETIEFDDTNDEMESANGPIVCLDDGPDFSKMIKK